MQHLYMNVKIVDLNTSNIWFKKNVLVSCVDPDTVAYFLDVMGFRPSISLNGKEIKTHMQSVAEAILVSCRKIPVDTPLDLSSFSLHTNGFGDRHAAVCLDHDVTVPIEDGLSGPAGEGQRKDNGKNQSRYER